MKNYKVLKFIASILFGTGVGICIGVAIQNALPGILVGAGLSMCLAVALNFSSEK